MHSRRPHATSTAAAADGSRHRGAAGAGTRRGRRCWRCSGCWPQRRGKDASGCAKGRARSRARGSGRPRGSCSCRARRGHESLAWAWPTTRAWQSTAASPTASSTSACGGHEPGRARRAAVDDGAVAGAAGDGHPCLGLGGARAQRAVGALAACTCTRTCACSAACPRATRGSEWRGRGSRGHARGRASERRAAAGQRCSPMHGVHHGRGQGRHGARGLLRDDRRHQLRHGLVIRQLHLQLGGGAREGLHCRLRRPHARRCRRVCSGSRLKTGCRACGQHCQRGAGLGDDHQAVEGQGDAVAGHFQGQRVQGWGGEAHPVVHIELCGNALHCPRCCSCSCGGGAYTAAVVVIIIFEG